MIIFFIVKTTRYILYNKINWKYKSNVLRFAHLLAHTLACLFTLLAYDHSHIFSCVKWDCQNQPNRLPFIWNFIRNKKKKKQTKMKKKKEKIQSAKLCELSDHGQCIFNIYIKWLIQERGEKAKKIESVSNWCVYKCKHVMLKKWTYTIVLQMWMSGRSLWTIFKSYLVYGLQMHVIKTN